MNSKTFAFERVQRINGTHPHTHTHSEAQSLGMFCQQCAPLFLWHANTAKKRNTLPRQWQTQASWPMRTLKAALKVGPIHLWNEPQEKRNLLGWLINLLCSRASYLTGHCICLWFLLRLRTAIFLGVMMIRMIIYQFVTGSTWIVVEVSPAQFFVAPSKGLRAH